MISKRSKKYQGALRFISGILKSERRSLIYYIVFVCVVASLEAIIPYITKIETDQLVQKHTSMFGFYLADPYTLFVYIVAIIGLVGVFDALSNKLQEYYQRLYISSVEEKYMFSLLKRLRGIQLGMYLNKRNQKFIASFWTGDCISAIRSLLVDGILTNIIRITGIIIVFSQLRIQLLGLVLVTIAVWFFLDKWEKIEQNKHQLLARYTYDHKLWDMKKHITDSFDKIVVSGGYDFSMNTIHNLTQEKASFNTSNQRRSLQFSLWSYGNIQIGEIAVKLLVGYAIIHAGASVGVMVMTLLYVGQLKSFFRAMFGIQDKIHIVSDEIERLHIYLSMTTPQKSGDLDMPSSIHSIKINGVDFAYPKISPQELEAYGILIKRLEKHGARKANERVKNTIHYMSDAFQEATQPLSPVLQNINLDFERGKTYGVVGANGAGKTTLMHVLMGYFTSYNGVITYNNIDLAKINPRSYDDVFGVITQEPFLFYSCTIRENLLMGVKRSYTDDELYAQLDVFNLTEKVKSMRKGLDSSIGYDGDFSGGQKQIIVLIRIMLQDRPILIVDEGTNQLDAENEGRIMEYLMQRKKDKIIIFITHKITTIRKADEIICISEGRIANIGTHQELLQYDNIYHNFWDRQVGFDNQY